MLNIDNNRQIMEEGIPFISNKNLKYLIINDSDRGSKVHLAYSPTYKDKEVGGLERVSEDDSSTGEYEVRQSTFRVSLGSSVFSDYRNFILSISKMGVEKGVMVGNFINSNKKELPVGKIHTNIFSTGEYSWRFQSEIIDDSLWNSKSPKTLSISPELFRSSYRIYAIGSSALRLSDNEILFIEGTDRDIVYLGEVHSNDVDIEDDQVQFGVSKVINPINRPPLTHAIAVYPYRDPFMVNGSRKWGHRVCIGVPLDTVITKELVEKYRDVEVEASFNIKIS